MAYSQGGLIAATDYNGFVGTSPSSTANTINTVWAVGNGQYGYGQTALNQVSATGLVTAAQWASAINTLNSIKTHQTGSGTGISAPTAGGLISYLSTFSGAINTAYSSHLSFNTQGSTTTGSGSNASFSIGSDATYNAVYANRTVTFASADQARYFFNAGGQINLVITGVSNNDGTNRSTDAVNTIGTYLGGVSAFRATTNGGRTGTGGTANTNNTSFGYYNLATSATTTHQVTTSSGTYSSDYAYVQFKTNSINGGGNGDYGSVITISLGYYSAHNSTGSDTTTVTNDTINVTVSHRIDVVYPETTNLSNTWGTVTIA